MIAGDADAAEEYMARHLGHVRSLWAAGQEEGAEERPARRLGTR